MIEIVLDENNKNEFCGKEYKIIELRNENLDSWNEYKLLARELIEEHKKESAIIIKIQNENCSLNKLSLALFVESVKIPTNIEYVVFKVDNLAKARETYNPYIALTIAIKYALNLVEETPRIIYKNIAGLGYLGLDIENDYAANTISIQLANSHKEMIKIETDNAFDALAISSVLKALSLAKVGVSIELICKLNEKPCLQSKDAIVEKIITDISPWIN